MELQNLPPRVKAGIRGSDQETPGADRFDLLLAQYEPIGIGELLDTGFSEPCRQTGWRRRASASCPAFRIPGLQNPVVRPILRDLASRNDEIGIPVPYRHAPAVRHGSRLRRIGGEFPAGHLAAASRPIARPAASRPRWHSRGSSRFRTILGSAGNHAACRRMRSQQHIAFARQPRDPAAEHRDVIGVIGEPVFIGAHRAQAVGVDDGDAGTILAAFHCSSSHRWCAPVWRCR